MDSISVKSMRSLLTHVKEENDVESLKITSSEDIDDPESMHDSRKITANSDERLIHDLNDDLSSQRRDIFAFDLQDSPDPYIIVDDDDDDDDNGDNGDNDKNNDSEIRDVHRKQTTQQDFLDSDYSFSLRFNTPYNVQK
jgi:hypothetical protein